jgi:hypothetical protein
MESGGAGQLHGSESQLNAPSGHADRNPKFAGNLARSAEYGSEWVSVLAAGFNDSAGKPLSNLDCFSDTSAFRN